MWGIQLPDWLTPILGNTKEKMINRICTYLARYPNRTAAAVQKVNETLQNSDQAKQTFVSTIAYLNSAENQQKLVNGAGACPSFFSEIQAAIQSDLSNSTGNAAQTKQKAMDIVNKLTDQLQKSIS